MNLRKLQHKNPLTFYNASVATEVEIPLVFSKVSAGFPSPADDFLDLNIDLNKHLVKNQYTTFFVKVSGNNKIKFGSQSLGRQWKMKQERLLPRYTTNIKDIMKTTCNQ